MIVVDPHAFKRLWPALGVWLFLFLTAGDAVALFRRQLVLAKGKPAIGVITSKGYEDVPMLWRTRRAVVYFRRLGPDGRFRTSKEAVSGAWSALEIDQEVPVHLWGPYASLDDDLGYSRWKGIVFGGIFAALWLWALGRYRFG